MSTPPIEQRKWRLSRDVSLADVLAIGLAILALMTSYFDLKQDIKALQIGQSHLQQEQDRTNSSAEKYRAETREDLKEINKKLDKLLERR